jgi:hypothetical protein
MPQLVSNLTGEVSNAITTTAPSTALGWIALKGQKRIDQIYLAASSGSGAAPLSGTSTDAAPALAGINVYLKEVLFLAWKVAGQETVEIRQAVLAEDGQPLSFKWEPLPVASGKSSNPTVSTDAAPALAVGANNLLYMVWKTPGANARMAWSVYDGTGWSIPEMIPTGTTSLAPALAGFNTSGPGNVCPLCLAFQDALSDDVFWAMFTPGDTSITLHAINASTALSPAVTTGPALPSGVNYSYFIMWLPTGGNLSFTQVSSQGGGQVFTLPQAITDLTPACQWFETAPRPGLVEETLEVIYIDSKGKVWWGYWPLVLDPAPFPGQLEGLSNYVFLVGTQCALLNKVTIQIEITQDLDSSAGFSIQLNTNTPKNAKNYSRCAWQQCGLEVDSNGNLSAWVNNWEQGANTPTIATPGGASPYLLYQWPTPKIPAGWTLGIVLQYNSDLSVKAAEFSAAPPGGGDPISNSIKFTDHLRGGFPASGLTANDYLAQICALQLVVVGYSDRADADFKSGAGMITFTAEEKLTATNSRPTCSDPTSTGEQSNIIYGPVTAKASTTLSQAFYTSPKKN